MLCWVGVWLIFIGNCVLCYLVCVLKKFDNVVVVLSVCLLGCDVNIKGKLIFVELWLLKNGVGKYLNKLLSVSDWLLIVIWLFLFSFV